MIRKTRFRFILFFMLATLALPAFAQTQPQPPAQPRTRVLFNDGWLFQKGDPAKAGDTLRYDNIRGLIIHTGDNLLPYLPPSSSAAPARADFSGISYSRPDFNDTAWRKLTLPHDWGIEDPFSQDLPGDTGKLPWAGIGWYRKHFSLPINAAANGRRTFLEIDGAMSNALVFLNGHLVGGWPYGYSSWRVDLTPYLKTGDGAKNENVLAIRLDNPPKSSRWYPGSGIYRNVWLAQTAPIAVAQWGVFVTTPEIATDRSRALVNVNVTLDNYTDKPADNIEVTVRLFAADVPSEARSLTNGRPAGPALATSAPNATGPSPKENKKIRIPAGSQANCAASLAIASPRLWGLAQRNRYVAETIVTQNGKILDRTETPFGIRTLAFTPDRGFLLNGERVPIRGVCQHADLGALGTAINTRALERQLEILQAMGCNAIRTSHNPPAPELLDLCDRMGFLVMDEAFDMWAKKKNPNDYGNYFPDWHEKDLRALVRRDRNHPSVILWSIGNEVLENGAPDGWKLAAHLAAIAREEDRTRPVTAACNSVESGYNGFQDVLDVYGGNYKHKPKGYATFRATHPGLVIFGSETQSAISSRGEYFFPLSERHVNFQVSSYDLDAVLWGCLPDEEWRVQKENPTVLGEFVWTGFDYLGEPTPYNNDTTNLLNFSDPAQKKRMADELKRLGKLRVPSRSSYFGIIDLAGFPKDRYYLFQSHWRPDLPMAHILPHWTWPERVGQNVPVFVYSSGDEAELFLNGKSLGHKKLGTNEYRYRWDNVKYEPGELKVVTWKNGKPWAEAVMRTAGAPAKIQLAADRTSLRDDGEDLSFVTVTIADKDGVMAPRANNLVRFSVSGPGEIVAVDNGDATSFESFQANERKAFNGLALVVVRTKPGQAGAIKLVAQSEGLAAAEVTLQSDSASAGNAELADCRPSASKPLGGRREAPPQTAKKNLGAPRNAASADGVAIDTTRIPALKDVFAKYFKIGAALERSFYNGDSPARSALVVSQFNAVTPEIAMMWQFIHPDKDRYDFVSADRCVDFAMKNNLTVSGHMLVWHQLTPKWVFQNDDGTPATRETLLAHMRDHIHTVVGRYKGRVKSWDVVNEALDDDGKLRDTPWRRIIGDDYIEQAFRFAHEADPDAELYYNDWGIENGKRLEGALALLRKLKADGVPIAAVGIQEHVDLNYPSAKDVDKAIEAFGKLGVKVMITELDVDMLPRTPAMDEANVDITVTKKTRPEENPYTNGLPENLQAKLARRYAELFAVYLKHRDVIESVSFWGVTDRESWLNNWPVSGRTNYPLLFDREGKPKPAFFAVVKTAEDAAQAR